MKLNLTENSYINHKNFTTIIFILTILICSVVYDYYDILFYRPQSVHAWRQADCASQVLNYAEKDYNFTKPQMHAQISNNYTTGYCVEDFPIIFFITATLYKIFGSHEIIFKIINLIIFYLGLFFLLRLYKSTINNKFWSFILTLLFFTAPVIVYYANNYISNVPAISVSIIGWYFFFKYYETTKQKFLLLSIILFTLGGLLKISELINLFTLIGIIFLDCFKFIKFKDNKRIFEKKLFPIIFLTIALIIELVWFFYAVHYNYSHDQKYYIYQFETFFTLDKFDIQNIETSIVTYLLNYYQNKIVLTFYILTFILNLIFFKNTNKLYLAISFIMLIGSIIFVFVFFQFLRNHDYYIISLFITTIFSTITLLDVLIRKYQKTMNSIITKSIIIIFLIYCIHYADKKMHSRYFGWENNDSKNLISLYEINPYLKEIGILTNDKVISIPDNSPNLTLYLMNQSGWTGYINQDYSKLIPFVIERNAKYLIINDSILLNDPKVKPFLYHQVGKFKNISIFKLDNKIDSLLVK